jgi:hypothetical protein
MAAQEIEQVKQAARPLDPAAIQSLIDQTIVAAITPLTKQVEELIARPSVIPTLSNDQDTKYVLTKAKLLRLMKELNID